MPDYTGKRAGNYTIVQKLGDGGFATVYLAQHTILEKKAAVKFLLEEWVNEPDVVSRFFDEARTMERLKDHPNIISIIDIASHEQCQQEGLPPYFIMEYVDGKSLEQLIHSDEGFTLEFVINVISCALSALDHCHKMGVVHRDIKPSNILLKSDGTVKLTDFGIAKAKVNTSKTGAGLTLGSTDYMSPEQALGKRDLDHRSDIYSLGVTLYELVTGKLPFVADNPNSVALMHIQENPKPPIEINDAVPPRLNDIILKAMEKKREDRFQSCQEFLDALKKLDEPEPPVVAEVETVDLSKMKAELPEENLMDKESGITPAVRATRSQAALAGPSPVRLVLFWVAVVLAFALIILGGFKAYQYFQLCPVTFSSIPPGAQVALDGKVIGTAPVTLSVGPAPARVVMTLEGFHPLAARLEPTPGRPLSFERTLRKLEPQALEDIRAGIKAYEAAAAGPAKNRQQAMADALRRLGRHLDDHPAADEAHLEFVRFCIKHSLLPNGEVYYRHRLSKFPDHPLYLTMLGMLLAAKGAADEALDLYTKAWYKDPDSVILLNALGDFFLAKKDTVRAEQYFKLSIFLDPTQDEVLQKLQGL
ncbi:MAG: Serine/threonine protein kinase PrkC, regulator of stationary phase [Candidatus Ozemobacter sibiricus]|jgi:tRNA A-37 threonylcarbamoyl transferase component Bud32/tetratricopeptide (TPR) repeat protein|uniref:non-specific serine/threonine protein kinase n=1 Tax=Candidatus Ozemobacter sibiricus TaxID=2268124 RepID=A0A367ZWN4_9BACT|nr:MAG: Serine/threonine protein kinase PrkC, regulator of stationary phase [Candidatus Ozemobacter sibiricus]